MAGRADDVRNASRSDRRRVDVVLDRQDYGSAVGSYKLLILARERHAGDRIAEVIVQVTPLVALL